MKTFTALSAWNKENCYYMSLLSLFMFYRNVVDLIISLSEG